MGKARLLAPLSLFLYAALTGFSQPPSQSNARYTLRGSVVNSVTGEPIRKALVEVNGPQAKGAFTGADGQYQLEDLPGGSYFVTVRRPGFMDWSTNQMLQPSNVTLGPDTNALTLKLAPFAKISGHVLDTEGEPVANLNVQCIQQTMQSGHKRWQRAQVANTDEAGHFLIDDVQPGKFLLATRQQQVYPGLIANDQASRLIYRRLYYPNSPDIGSAQSIDLTPGEDAQADITVSTVRGTRVFFSVVPAQPWVQAMLRDESGEEVESQIRRDIRTGGWILPSIPPGSWRLIVSSGGANGQLSGETAIEVGDADLRNVVVPLSNPSEVPIVFTGGAANASPAANILLIPFSPDMAPNVYGADGSGIREGHAVVHGAPPGTYHVIATSVGADCVESITAGASDLARLPYVVSAGSSPQPINIGLRSDCASLEISTSQQSVQMVAAVIVGGPYAMEPQIVIGFGKAIAKLAPGDYEVFAFTNVNSIEYANPDVLKNYTGQHISLSPHQTASMRFDSINAVETK